MSNYFNGKGTIGFICDNCGREVNGCSIVNGMKFCAKCYQETFGKDNQQNEIQQLKQQLDEKDKEIEMLKHVANFYNLKNKGFRFININELAIRELEKVKILLQNAVNYEGYTFVEIYDAVNNQIKELKGE